MTKPEHVEVRMKTQTLRVLLRVFGNTSHAKRSRMGIPDDINREASKFYRYADRELMTLGYARDADDWRNQ